MQVGRCALESVSVVAVSVFVSDGVRVTVSRPAPLGGRPADRPMQAPKQAMNVGRGRVAEMLRVAGAAILDADASAPVGPGLKTAHIHGRRVPHRDPLVIPFLQATTGLRLRLQVAVLHGADVTVTVEPASATVIWVSGQAQLSVGAPRAAEAYVVAHVGESARVVVTAAHGTSVVVFRVALTREDGTAATVYGREQEPILQSGAGSGAGAAAGAAAGAGVEAGVADAAPPPLRV